jgi:hypothetical protein
LDIWDSPIGRTFFGYAPVLQAVASVLSSITNYHEAEHRFQSFDSHHDALALLSRLIDDLLVREQAKVTNALREQLPTLQVKWDSLYAPQEQIGRVLRHHLADAEALRPGAECPPEAQDAYTTALLAFVPNHPFLRDADFAGPAFREYTLAVALSRGDDWAELLLDDAPTMLSPLFAGFYSGACGGIGKGTHATYLYESAIARYGLEAGVLSTVVAPGENQDMHELVITPEDRGSPGSEPFSIRMTVSSEQPLVFGHRLSNAYIVTPSVLILGRADANIELSNVEVSAGSLDIRASKLIVRRHATEHVVVMQAGAVSEKLSLVKVEAPDRTALVVRWPGAERFPWAPYHRDAPFAEQLNPQGAMLALRRILTWFRRDRKEEFKRYRDLIDNVAVGHNRTRQAMLAFLMDRGVLRLDGRMYTFDDEAARRHGINWSALSRTEPAGPLATLIDDFLQSSAA